MPSSSPPGPTVLGSAAELLLATDHDPYVRSTLRRGVVTAATTGPGAGSAGSGRATAWLGVDGDEQRPYLSAVGDPAAAAALLADWHRVVGADVRHGERLTVPRGTAALLPAWWELRGTDWDFRWVDTAPPEQAAEESVELLPLDDAAGAGTHALAALLDRASPTASVRPGDPRARRWWVVRGPRGALACAADTSSVAGVGHLSAIAVDPDTRGAGLGAAVTAAAVRRLLAEGCDLVTLGMYADNVAGRALYDALGFHDDHRFTSGPVAVRHRW